MTRIKDWLISKRGYKGTIRYCRNGLLGSGGATADAEAQNEADADAEAQSNGNAPNQDDIPDEINPWDQFQSE